MTEERWYPGKFMGRTKKHGSDEHTSSEIRALQKKFVDNNTDEKVRTRTQSHDSHDIMNLNSDLTHQRSYHHDPVGHLTISLAEIRFVTAAQPNFRVTVENVSKSCKLQEGHSPSADCTFSFDFCDISSDIVITLTDDYEIRSGKPVIGRVIIPINTHLGTSTPLQPKLQWRQIYPMSAFRRNFGRYKGDLEDVFDSAMTKPKIMGFLAVKTELTLSIPVTNLYTTHRFNAGSEPAWSWSDEKGADKERERDEEPAQIQWVCATRNKDVVMSKVRRDQGRLMRLWVAPPALAPLLRFPEVFVLIGMLSCFLFALHAWQYPLVLWTVTLFNGSLSQAQRSFAAVKMWTDPVATARVAVSQGQGQGQGGGAVSLSSSAVAAGGMSQAQGSGGSASSVSGSSGSFTSLCDVPTVHSLACGEFLMTMYHQCHQRASVCEKIFNLANFSDSRVSMIFYFATGCFCVGCSAFLMLFEVRSLLLVLLVMSACAAVARDHCCEVYLTHKDDLDRAANMDLASDATLSVKLATALYRLHNFWSRVPDELDMIHSFIAGTCVVKEGGAEMLDAADARKNSS